MRTSRADAALEEITAVRRAFPDQQLAITYEATALRQLNDPKYNWLCNYDRHLRVYDLEPPRGFTSIADFNAALGGLLRKGTAAQHTRWSNPCAAGCSPATTWSI